VQGYHDVSVGFQWCNGQPGQNSQAYRRELCSSIGLASQAALKATSDVGVLDPRNVGGLAQVLRAKFATSPVGSRVSGVNGGLTQDVLDLTTRLVKPGGWAMGSQAVLWDRFGVSPDDRYECVALHRYFLHGQTAWWCEWTDLAQDPSKVDPSQKAPKVTDIIQTLKGMQAKPRAAIALSEEKLFTEFPFTNKAIYPGQDLKIKAAYSANAGAVAMGAGGPPGPATLQIQSQVRDIATGDEAGGFRAHPVVWSTLAATIQPNSVAIVNTYDFAGGRNFYRIAGNAVGVDPVRTAVNTKDGALADLSFTGRYDVSGFGVAPSEPVVASTTLVFTDDAPAADGDVA
jgi:hypothetical protein